MVDLLSRHMGNTTQDRAAGLLKASKKENENRLDQITPWVWTYSHGGYLEALPESNAGC